MADRKRILTGWIKIKSKKWLKVTDKLEKRAIEYAKKKGYSAIILGHSHIAENKIINDIVYANSGSFSEKICHYLIIEDGIIELKEI